jgi:DNA-directed RNA polymerase subunit K/omega
MLNSKTLTIQEHEAITGSRYTLAMIVSKRVNQLLKGARPKPGLGPDFDFGRDSIAPNRLAKIALEEIRTGKLKWSHTTKPEVKDTTTPDDIIFDGK